MTLSTRQPGGVPRSPLPLLSTPAHRQISPDFVRISYASAIALGMKSGRFSRDFEFGGINLLLNYDEGCLSDCGYCGLARSRQNVDYGDQFIRVEWPLVGTDEVAPGAMAERGTPRPLPPVVGGVALLLVLGRNGIWPNAKKMIARSPSEGIA